ncbi:hypothetical protein JGH11_06260 [Dysgonomonas sp. Marseille-P4677]|uniref:hypothetical protein n=1 Tax=Dysgonomonas sp. Marseille-P4677 TaxID=2364790 RepID=UPI001911D42C|nr:hypothetical protein [Dysgonomonas sp. Marseille-P4677]MBK5720470.1 hypothetical protein [Dysgonomonas sp. Marseille-P4677]
MDLDNIKKTWQETNLKPTINEDKIRKMISNKGKSAFRRLLFHEKLGLFILIIFIPIGYFVLERHTSMRVIYLITTLSGIVWQLYKINRLKKVDLQLMTITQVSKHIHWYRTAILKEISFGVVWFILFFILLGYLDISENTDHLLRRIVALSIVIVVGLVFVLLTYRLLYLNNIKKLQASIKEIEEFEKGNKE